MCYGFTISPGKCDKQACHKWMILFSKNILDMPYISDVTFNQEFSSLVVSGRMSEVDKDRYISFNDVPAELMKIFEVEEGERAPSFPSPKLMFYYIDPAGQ